MKKVFNIITLLLFSASFSFSQTFNGTGGAIPDDGSTVFFPITVSGLSPSTIDTVFGLETICVNITHTYDSDLDIFLVAPDGTEITLISAVGGGDDNFTNTCLNNNADTSIIDGIAPFTGMFRPLGSLGLINNGQTGNGLWQLKIHDTYPFADSGTLLDWSITFGNNPAVPFNFTSSNLPIVVINTGGQSIPDDPKILVQMGIIDNGPGIRNNMTDPFNEYNGYAGIEIRGSSSQMFPKKSYGFETTDSLLSSINASLCGMPPESDWILNANYTDKTLMRNVLSYKLSGEEGHYASRTCFCELVINGEYLGNYVLMEKIKRDHWRVDIPKMTSTSNSGDSLTGGYIIKIDKQTGSGGAGWTSNYLPPVHPSGQTIYFQYDYPKDNDITTAQQAYIQAYVDTFETVLNGTGFADTLTGYRKYADVKSFIDYWIINEISKNIDGYRLSTFLYKDRKSLGGKLYIGPVWDYDIAWHNANYYGGDISTGWAYHSTGTGDSWQVPFWWDRMMQDTKFVNDLNCRWLYLRSTILSFASLDNYVDTTAIYLNESQTRNFLKWPILGIYVWPNPSPLPTTYQGEIDNLKTWIHDRLLWIDNNIPGICTSVKTPELADNSDDFNIYPNPATNNIYIHFNSLFTQEHELQICNMQGQVMIKLKLSEMSNVVDIHLLSAGIYFAKTVSGKSVCVKKFVKD